MPRFAQFPDQCRWLGLHGERSASWQVAPNQEQSRPNGCRSVRPAVCSGLIPTPIGVGQTRVASSRSVRSAVTADSLVGLSSSWWHCEVTRGPAWPDWVPRPSGCLPLTGAAMSAGDHRQACARLSLARTAGHSVTMAGASWRHCCGISTPTTKPAGGRRTRPPWASRRTSENVWQPVPPASPTRYRCSWPLAAPSCPSSADSAVVAVWPRTS